MRLFLFHPAGILTFFGGLMLAAGGFTWLDGSRRPTLEGIEFPSALGDKRLFPGPDRFPFASEVVRQDGRPYFRARFRPASRQDGNMRPAGKDDSGSWILYREAPDTGTGEDPDLRYLKLARNAYLPLTPTPHVPSAPAD